MGNRACTVIIRDRSACDPKHGKPEKREVILHGRWLNGPHVLVKFKKTGSLSLSAASGKPVD